ncbi:hypothetical protein Taro_014557 [Colocasia esculenta]|uniref:Uncharacterized protein n=1 Tax=Colocasia esculenta TaxID=4460 RepID=A0A843UJQ8_COLES|nr:hypothetical protein [Colocasia esculenta]
MVVTLPLPRFLLLKPSRKKEDDGDAANPSRRAPPRPSIFSFCILLILRGYGASLPLASSPPPHEMEELALIVAWGAAVQRASRPWRTHNFFKGSVDTPHTSVDTMLQALSQNVKKCSSSVDTSPSQGINTLLLAIQHMRTSREPIHFQKKPFGGQRGFSRSVSISRSYKPSFQEEGQGNQGESLERRLLCKVREQIQLKRHRRRRISGISDAIKAEHRQLRRISIDFHQGSSIEASARPLH